DTIQHATQGSCSRPLPPQMASGLQLDPASTAERVEPMALGGTNLMWAISKRFATKESAGLQVFSFHLGFRFSGPARAKEPNDMGAAGLPLCSVAERRTIAPRMCVVPKPHHG